jgi:hypothetical protein
VACCHPRNAPSVRACLSHAVRFVALGGVFMTVVTGKLVVIGVSAGSRLVGDRAMVSGRGDVGCDHLTAQCP